MDIRGLSISKQNHQADVHLPEEPVNFISSEVFEKQPDNFSA